MNEFSLILLFRVLVAHFLADFLFVAEGCSNEICDRRWKSVRLYLHAAFSSILIYVFSTLFNVLWFSIIIFVSRVLFEGLNFSKGDRGKSLLFEQLGKIVVLLICFTLLEVSGSSRDIMLFLSVRSSFKFWVISFSYIAVFWPVGFLIGQMTEQWRQQIKKESLEGLGKAGLWIGRLERLLILTFVLINRFEAIGFLIAAKSIFRIGEITNSKNRKVAEYILIGTLLSVVTAIFVGIVAKWLLSQSFPQIQHF
jgi:hypothetical protein